MFPPAGSLAVALGSAATGTALAASALECRSLLPQATARARLGRRRPVPQLGNDGLGQLVPAGLEVRLDESVNERLELAVNRLGHQGFDPAVGLDELGVHLRVDERGEVQAGHTAETTPATG